MHMVVCVHMCVYVCVLATGLVLKRACKGEVVPSLASSLPSHKWAGCTREERGKKGSLNHQPGTRYKTVMFLSKEI